VAKGACFNRLAVILGAAVLLLAGVAAAYIPPPAFLLDKMAE
jgi:hypothetical protein